MAAPSNLAVTEARARANPRSRAAKEAKLRLPLRYLAHLEERTSCVTNLVDEYTPFTRASVGGNLFNGLTAA